jgi:Transposase DDE domain group 1
MVMTDVSRRCHRPAVRACLARRITLAEQAATTGVPRPQPLDRTRQGKTLHPLIATASTPISRPVVVAIRLRQGKAADVRGAARLLAEALTTVRAIAPTAQVIVRADSKFYTADIAATAARYSADVSLTTGSNPSVTAAIGRIPDIVWTAIHYPNAFVDTETGQLISDAEVAHIRYTAFTSRPKHQHMNGWLIVRRVKRLNPKAAAGQDGLFDVWRYHAVFVTSDITMLQAESQHRDHAIIEQIIADAAASALAHLPCGSFTANAAWAVLWAIAHNLTRALGCLAGSFHARATTATIRAHLITVPARLARSARRIVLHLPEHWPWQPAWQALHAERSSRRKLVCRHPGCARSGGGERTIRRLARRLGADRGLSLRRGLVRLGTVDLRGW